jgi:hypothetical protein
MNLTPFTRVTKAFALLSITLISFQSCVSTKTEKKTIEVQLSSDGPYFAGGNSFMNTVTPDLKTLIEEKELTPDDIVSIKMSTAKLTITETDEFSFDLFNSASLQLVGDNAPMASIAILNPIIASEAKTVELTVSSEADLSPFFKEPSFTYLLDLDFKEDDFSDQMNVTLSIELTVEYK